MVTDKPEIPTGSENWRAAIPALALAIASGLFLLALGLKMPSAKEPVALVFGPSVAGESTIQRIAALDGRVVRFGGTAS